MDGDRRVPRWVDGYVERRRSIESCGTLPIDTEGRRRAKEVGKLWRGEELCCWGCC